MNTTMMKKNSIKYVLFPLFFLIGSATVTKAQINTSDDTPLRVIAIFAHPDDADSKMGGTAARRDGP